MTTLYLVKKGNTSTKISKPLTRVWGFGILVLFILTFSHNVYADDIFTDTFEGYSTGSLSGQGLWLSTGGTWQQVVSSPTDTGTRALYTFEQVTNHYTLQAQYASSTSGTFSFRTRLNTGSLDVTSSRPGVGIYSTQGVSLPKLQLFYGGSGLSVRSEADGTIFATNVALDAWHTVSIDFYCASDWKYTVSVDGVDIIGEKTGQSCAGAQNDFDGVIIYSGLSSNNFDLYYDNFGFDSGGGQEEPNTSTRFLSVSPANGTTTATTTTLGQGIYVNENDLSSTTAVTTVYTNDYCSSFSGAVIDAVSNTLGQGCSFTLTWAVGSSGENTFSTSTTFTYGGTWRYVSTIYDTVGQFCLFGYCLSSSRNDLSQVSGSFVVGQLNALDVIHGYIASSSAELGGLASSTAAISSLCNPLSGSFSLGSCVYVLIIPDASTTKSMISGVSGKFLTYVPLGYVTRFIAIFTSGTTTPLPVFSYTPPAVLGYSQGALNLNPWNLFSTTSFIGSLTSSTSTGSRTLRSIAEPYWNFLWTLILAIAIIGRITGIYPHFHSRGLAQDTSTKGRKGFKHVADETYRYKEKLYDLSKLK